MFCLDQQAGESAACNASTQRAGYLSELLAQLLGARLLRARMLRSRGRISERHRVDSGTDGDQRGWRQHAELLLLLLLLLLDCASTGSAGRECLIDRVIRRDVHQRQVIDACQSRGVSKQQQQTANSCGLP